MQLREYQPSDCAQMTELFYQTVHSVNAKDYTKEQLDAWVIGEVDLQAWDKSFRAHKTICGTGLQIDKNFRCKIRTFQGHRQSAAGSCEVVQTE